MQPNDFAFTEENFLKLEELLAAKRPGAEDLWKNRVSLFCSLTATPFVSTEKKFKLGLGSYFLWILSKVWTAKAYKPQAPPPADFLVHIIGDVSKEIDTLLPVISALRSADRSVLVLWNRDSPIPDKVAQELNGATAWIPPSEIEFAGPRSLILRDLLSTFGLLVRAAFYLRSFRGVSTAFLKRSAAWFHHLFYLRRWERFLTTTLASYQFKGVAVVSETAYTALALCRIANQRGWPVHHFLHGLPNLLHTRQEATDTHCFSQIERNFFIEHGWDGNRVHARGHPRQVEMLSQIRSVRESPPEEGGIRILFTSTGGFAGFQTAGFDDDYRSLVLATVFQAAEELHLTESEIRIRPHPTETQGILLEMLSQYAPHLRAEVISNRSLVQDLAWANVVITDFSTTAIESCYAGCFLVWLGLGHFPYEIREKLIENGYGHRVGCLAELSAELSLCRNPVNRSALIHEFVTAGRALSILDPNAAVNAAAVMMRAS